MKNLLYFIFAVLMMCSKEAYSQNSSFRISLLGGCHHFTGAEISNGVVQSGYNELNNWPLALSVHTADDKDFTLGTCRDSYGSRMFFLSSVKSFWKCGIIEARSGVFLTYKQVRQRGEKAFLWAPVATLFIDTGRVCFEVAPIPVSSGVVVMMLCSVKI